MGLRSDVIGDPIGFALERITRLADIQLRLNG